MSLRQAPFFLGSGEEVLGLQLLSRSPGSWSCRKLIGPEICTNGSVQHRYLWVGHVEWEGRWLYLAKKKVPIEGSVWNGW